MADLAIACSLPAAQLQERQVGLLTNLAALARERALVENGVRLRFATAPETLALLQQVVTAERECCRFLRFQISYEPDLGPIDLEVTGPSGTREFLQATLGF